MPVPQLWAIFFFIMMATLGFGSQFSIVECVLSAFTDEFAQWLRGTRESIIFRWATHSFLFSQNWSKTRAVSQNIYDSVLVFLSRNCQCCAKQFSVVHVSFFRTSIIFVTFLLGLPMVMGGGIYLLNLVDYSVSGFPLLFVGLLECMALSWIYGKSVINIVLFFKCWFIGLVWQFTVVTHQCLETHICQMKSYNRAESKIGVQNIVRPFRLCWFSGKSLEPINFCSHDRNEPIRGGHRDDVGQETQLVLARLLDGHHSSSHRRHHHLQLRGIQTADHGHRREGAVLLPGLGSGARLAHHALPHDAHHWILWLPLLQGWRLAGKKTKHRFTNGRQEMLFLLSRILKGDISWFCGLRDVIALSRASLKNGTSEIDFRHKE